MKRFLFSVGTEKVDGAVSMGISTVDGPVDVRCAIITRPSGGTGLVLELNGFRLQLLRSNGRFRLSFHDVSGSGN